MAQIPNFDRIVATVTAADIEKFLHSTAPEDDKQRVRNAATDEIKMRLVGGYLIRSNQITPARMKAILGKTTARAAGSRTLSTAKSRSTSARAKA